MFNSFLRQQARFGLSLCATTALPRQSQRSILALATKKSSIIPQRTFSTSRRLFQETAQSTQEENSSRSVSRLSPRGLSRVLYLSNLPYNIEEGEIRALFSPYGEIQRIQLDTDNQGRYVGRGYLQFYNHEAATQAIESGLEEPFVISDRKLFVQFAKTPPRAWRFVPGATENIRHPGRPFNVIHIVNYPAPGDSRPLRELLGDSQDKIQQINFMKGPDGNPTAKTFVRFATIETAQSVLEELEGRELMGVQLRVYFALDGSSQGRSYKTLTITNYPIPGDDRPLREVLGAAQNKVLRINVGRDDEGNSTQRAFIHFADEETAQNMFNELKGLEFMGVNLIVYPTFDRET